MEKIRLSADYGWYTRLQDKQKQKRAWDFITHTLLACAALIIGYLLSLI